MQQTENYKLNLIESTDTFSPEALNENAKTTERELLAVRGEFAAADAAHAADTTQHAFVKLGRFEVPAGQTVSFPIADATPYTMLLLDVNLKGAVSSYFTVRINGANAGYLVPSSSYKGMMHGTFFLFPAGTTVGGFYISTGEAISGNRLETLFVHSADWSSFNTLGFLGSDADAIVTVYAINK